MSSSTTVSGLATEPGPAHSAPAPSAPGEPSPAAETQGIGSEGWATRLLRSAPLLLGIAYAAGALAWFPRWTVDDAYITFRYAENLAHHGELNWNVGENPVEGYTGVLLPLTLAAGTWLGLPVGPTAKLIGIASLFLGGALLWALAGRVGLERASRSVVALGYFRCPILYTHALGGLETVLFLALGLAGLLALAAQLQEPGPSRAVGLPLALLLTSLARPEGVALTVFVFAAALFDAFRRSRAALTRLGVDVLLFYALPAACYFAWRWGYYGQALPNTYYAKWHRGLVPGSLRDMALFSALYLALPVLALTVLWVARRASRESEPCARVRTLRVVLAIGLAFTAVCLATYARSSLVMNYSHRFFAPFLPILLLHRSHARTRLERRGRERSRTDSSIGAPRGRRVPRTPTRRKRGALPARGGVRCLHRAAPRRCAHSRGSVPSRARPGARVDRRRRGCRGNPVRLGTENGGFRRAQRRVPLTAFHRQDPQRPYRRLLLRP